MFAMPPFTSFLILVGLSLSAVLVLRFALLRTGRHLQRHVGFSDTALTDLVITVPLLGFVFVFLAGLVWLWS